jgi:hypothetical protein
VILPVAASQFALGQTMAAPIRTAAQGKQADAGPTPVRAAALAQTPPAQTQKDASSAFSQMVAQMVAESADTETAPTPAVPVPAAAAQALKLPSKLANAAAAFIDPLADPSAAVKVASAPLPETLIPAGGRRADTRSAAPSNAGNAQPSSVPVDVNVPIPIVPKLPLPGLAGGGSTEQKVAAVSTAEETAPIRLEPQPILDVKIHLNQPEQQPAPVVPSPVASAAPANATQGDREEMAGQQSPERGSSDPGDPDTSPATEASGHPLPRIAVNQEAVAFVQQQRADAVSTPPLAHDSAAAPVGAMPAPPTPAPVSGRDATPEPTAGSALPREESPLDQTKTQQPLRSLALEFSPDGAGDIKVRLSERAGDVHISLHGTDPSLAGRVREGVGDLVGSLSRAGYDAEAWTPGEGRQNQRQQPDQRQPARDSSSREADAEEFSGIFQQPIQENS